MIGVANAIVNKNSSKFSTEKSSLPLAEKRSEIQNSKFGRRLHSEFLTRGCDLDEMMKIAEEFNTDISQVIDLLDSKGKVEEE